MNQMIALKSTLNRSEKLLWPEASPIKQYFSLPSSIVYYMAKNSSTPECYLKLIQSCKYFFEKNPILVVACIHRDGRFCSNSNYEFHHENQKCCIEIDFKKLLFNIWLTGELQIIPIAALFLHSKLYRCENARLSTIGTMSINEFKLWATKFHKFYLRRTNIVNSDERITMLDKILDCIPIVKEFKYSFCQDIPVVNSSTMENILKLKNLGSLRSFVLNRIPETANVSDISDFIKVHKSTKFQLFFAGNISNGYTNQLDALVDTVIASGVFTRFICYPRQDDEKFKIITADYYERKKWNMKEELSLFLHFLFFLFSPVLCPFFVFYFFISYML